MGYQGICINDKVAMSSHSVLDWAARKLEPRTPEDKISKEELWTLFKEDHAIDSELLWRVL